MENLKKTMIEILDLLEAEKIKNLSLEIKNLRFFIGGERFVDISFFKDKINICHELFSIQIGYNDLDLTFKEFNLEEFAEIKDLLNYLNKEALRAKKELINFFGGKYKKQKKEKLKELLEEKKDLLKNIQIFKDNL